MFTTAGNTEEDLISLLPFEKARREGQRTQSSAEEKGAEEEDPIKMLLDSLDSEKGDSGFYEDRLEEDPQQTENLRLPDSPETNAQQEGSVDDRKNLGKEEPQQEEEEGIYDQSLQTCP